MNQILKKEILINNIFKRKSSLCLGRHKSSSASSQDPGYQYLQRSTVPTYHFQKSLPRLPIPELHLSCSRYLDALRPLLTEAQLEDTFLRVEKFKATDGAELHEALVDKDRENKQTSYITEPWFEMYLKSRIPLVLNFNPFIVWKNDPDPQYNDQLTRASNMVISTLRFYRSLKEEVLEPDVYHLNPAKSDTPGFRRFVRMLPSALAWYGAFLCKAYPLDMSQFRNLFFSTRIPCIGQDVLRTFPDAKHLAVLHNGHFYVFDVLDKDGAILPPSHIQGCLHTILSDNTPPPSHPVSAFTTGNRDVWARYRSLLEKENSEALHLVDSAAYCLVLDDAHGQDLLNSAHMMLHGPAHNRWFDKSFQLLICKEGDACINFEHSWGDGVAILRLFNEVFEDSTKNHFVSPSSKPSAVEPSAVRRLEFRLDQTLKEGIERACRHYKDNTSLLELNPLIYETMNRESIKKKKLSPDFVMQLSFQMAYYKIYGKIPPTYESCSTAAFRHGRTETVRPTTAMTKRTVEKFEARNTSPSELLYLLKSCSERHNQLTKEAALGKGFDRHLFALKHLAEAKGLPAPDVFKDPNYVYANHYHLSTSTLYGHAFKAGGFAPVVPDGFGLAYSLTEESLRTLVASYCGQTNGAELHSAIEASLKQIEELLFSK